MFETVTYVEVITYLVVGALAWFGLAAIGCSLWRNKGRPEATHSGSDISPEQWEEYIRQDIQDRKDLADEKADMQSGVSTVHQVLDQMETNAAARSYGERRQLEEHADAVRRALNALPLGYISEATAEVFRSNHPQIARSAVDEAIRSHNDTITLQQQEIRRSLEQGTPWQGTPRRGTPQKSEVRKMPKLNEPRRKLRRRDQ